MVIILFALKCLAVAAVLVWIVLGFTWCLCWLCGFNDRTEGRR